MSTFENYSTFSIQDHQKIDFFFYQYFKLFYGLRPVTKGSRYYTSCFAAGVSDGYIAKVGIL